MGVVLLVVMLVMVLLWCMMVMVVMVLVVVEGVCGNNSSASIILGARDIVRGPPTFAAPCTSRTAPGWAGRRV